MYTVFFFCTNEQGVMTDTVALKTPNDKYAQAKIYELASTAVTSNVYVHTILCVDEHGNSKFNTPLYFEHIPEPAE